MFLEIIIGFTIIYSVYQLFKKPNGIPPGEWGLPIIGKIPPMNLPIRDYFLQLKKQYGDIFSIKLGGRLFVIISDFDLIKTALSKLELSGRPDFFTLQFFSFFKNYGILTSENRVWHDNRRFALIHLKEFGMGRSILEDTISRETVELMQDLDTKLDKPCELSWIINVAVLNVLWRIIASKRYNISDPEIIEFAEAMNDDIDVITGPAMLLDMFPQFEPYVPKIIKNKWMKINFLEKNRDRFDAFAMKIIKDHEEDIDYENLRDYIDCYLKEIKDQSHDNQSTFRPDFNDLIASIGDLFLAGSETTSTSIRYTCLYMIKYPEIQKKIQQEIDQIIPIDSIPNLQHKEKLVYLEATLLEVQRNISLLPLGFPHSATSETSLAGYKIPKGTVIMPFNEDCHNNPKYWEKPDEFYPEHFIDDQGKIITKKEGFLPFSVGRRVCIGESLAKMELFLFMASLLQRYNISEPEGENLQIKFDRNNILINGIKPFNVVFSKRI